MINKARTGWLRLAMGGALNIALWPIFMGLAKWSNLEREFNLNLVGGSVAGVTLVVVLPVFWKGIPEQTPIACLLIILPCYVCGGAILTAFKHW